MKSRVMFPDLEDREEWHRMDLVASTGDGTEELGEHTEVIPAEPKPAAVLDTPSDLAIGWVPHRAENRAMRRKAVATFAEPVAGLRRKLWLQRQKNRLGKLDVETRRLQRKAK